MIDPRQLIPGNKEYYDDLRAVLRYLASPAAKSFEEKRRREEAKALRLAAKRKVKRAERNEKRQRLKVWRGGVAKIMAEVRRREAERGLAGDTIDFLPNPLTGCNV